MRSVSLVRGEIESMRARATGPIENTSGGDGCEPFDVEKHLTTDRLKKKLGI